jgi:hypothetical protein
MARWLDTSGATPSFKPAAAISGMLATATYGFWAGGIEFLDSALGGLWGAMHGIRSFLADPGGVILGLAGVAETFATTAADQHALWLQSQGLFGVVIGAVEGVAIVYGVIWATKTAGRILLEAI